MFNWSSKIIIYLINRQIKKILIMKYHLSRNCSNKNKTVSFLVNFDLYPS